MKSNLFKLLVVMMFVSASSQLSSMGNNFSIIIENHLTGFVLNQTIEINYKTGSGSVSQKILPGETYKIGNIRELSDGAAIVFKGYGKVISFTLNQAALSKESLIQKWKELKSANKDASATIPLILTVNAEAATVMAIPMPVPYYKFTFAYSLLQTESFGMPSAEKKEKFSDNPLEIFSAIKKYDLQKYVTADQFLAFQRSDWKKSIVPAGRLSRATTAEDMARYILGLGEEYTSENALVARQNALNEWKQGSNDYQTEQFRAKIRQLINKAYDILETALLEKSPASSWTSLEASRTSHEHSPAAPSSSSQEGQHEPTAPAASSTSSTH